MLQLCIFSNVKMIVEAKWVLISAKASLLHQNASKTQLINRDNVPKFQ